MYAAKDRADTVIGLFVFQEEKNIESNSRNIRI